MPSSLTYPVTLGTYSQALGEVTEKTIGPAVLLFPLLQLGATLDYFLIFIFALGTFYSRYKKINYVNAQETCNEYERHNIEKNQPAKIDFKKRRPLSKNVLSG